MRFTTILSILCVLAGQLGGLTLEKMGKHPALTQKLISTVENVQDEPNGCL